MKHSRNVDKLSNFLAYILGRQPDEFGLVPDEQGYVKTKDLMKALAEESGWRYVRLSHLREVIHTTRLPVIEVDSDRIRAVDRSRLFAPIIPESLPKLLYYPIRQRAHPVVMEKGLLPDTAGHRIILADDLTLVQRLGRRIDPAPVILIVNSAKAIENGATIWRFGNHVFLSDRLPVGSFNGPPLPRQRTAPQKAEKPAAPSTPGSYLLDLTTPPASTKRMGKASRQRKNAWKQERKRKSRGKAFSQTDK